MLMRKTGLGLDVEKFTKDDIDMIEQASAKVGSLMLRLELVENLGISLIENFNKISDLQKSILDYKKENENASHT